MIVYRDMSFCMRDCGNIECKRNKTHIPWENELPVSYLRCLDCINWKPVKSGVIRDYYEPEYTHNKQLDRSDTNDI